MSNTQESHGLCHRCEHRARFLETKGAHRPRYECGACSSDADGNVAASSVRSCYMYKPVTPLVVAANDGDDRPVLGPAMISARVHVVRLAEGRFASIEVDDGIIPHWVPGKDGDA